MTRMEHVILVESISETIASYLGLNIKLTKAISMAHDIGHSPFGHKGERILSEISKKDIGKTFWHEQNGMEMVDENGLKPREEFIDLYEYKYANQYKPYTLEACAVKVSDKIAYLGRDIEDAIRLGMLDEHLEELHELLDMDSSKPINNTVIINLLISDVCENSNEIDGLRFSDKAFEFMNKLKEFNYKYIYLDERLKPSDEYFKLCYWCVQQNCKILKLKNGMETIVQAEINKRNLIKLNEVKAWKNL